MKKDILGAGLYKSLERIISQGITFVISLVLARLVSPSDYGVIAIVLTFTRIAQIVVHSGLNTALIQKEIPNITDYSTVFFISTALSVVLYLFLFIAAPAIENYYDVGNLTVILRVLGLILFPNAYNSIQYAIISKRLDFKKNLVSSVVASIVSGFISITIAAMGYGVWALILQQLSYQIVICITLQIILKWHPQRLFSKESAKGLFSFGWKLMVASFINKLGENVSNLIIARKYTTSIVGNFNQGKQYPQYAVGILSDTFRALIIPLVSDRQKDYTAVKTVMKKLLIFSFYITLPVSLGLFMTADEVIIILLSNKWINCVPFFRVFCIFYTLYPLHVINLQIISGIGRSNIFLRLEVIKKSMLIGILVFIAFFDVSALWFAYAELIMSVVSLYINTVYIKRLINYSLLEQIKDIFPIIASGLVMCSILALINQIEISIYLKLLSKVFAGGATYLAISQVLRITPQKTIVKYVKDALMARQHKHS